MEKKRIILRADGDLVAGYGHVIRTLSLAYILKKKYQTIFVIRQPDSFLKAQIKQVCDEIIEITAKGVYKNEADSIAKNFIRANDIVVLDGYHFDAEYQSRIKASCFKLVCIDDTYERFFTSDVVINHGEGINPENYSAEFYTKLYLGASYAILRKSFLKHTTHTLQKTFTNHRAFISMGGTDQQNYTKKALAVCIGNKNITSIDIITGSYYAHSNELNNTINSNKQIDIRLHTNLAEQEIAFLMKKSSVGICSASTVSYEYSCVGGILFVYQTVLNQKNIYPFLIQSGCAFPAEIFNKKLSDLKSVSVRNNYFENRNKFFSGDSPKKLRVIFEKLENERGISIRKASKKDLGIYFNWVNDNEVRQNSINTEPIALANHTNWFYTKLKNKNSFLYLIEKNNFPVGQVRFDETENGWETDYSVDRKYRGKGLGEIIVKLATIELRKKNTEATVIAKVKTSNIPSNLVFEKLHFTKNKQVKIGNNIYNQYSLSVK